MLPASVPACWLVPPLPHPHRGMHVLAPCVLCCRRLPGRPHDDGWRSGSCRRLHVRPRAAREEAQGNEGKPACMAGQGCAARPSQAGPGRAGAGRAVQGWQLLAGSCFGRPACLLLNLHRRCDLRSNGGSATSFQAACWWRGHVTSTDYQCLLTHSLTRPPIHLTLLLFLLQYKGHGVGGRHKGSK